MAADRRGEHEYRVAEDSIARSLVRPSARWTSMTEGDARAEGPQAVFLRRLPGINAMIRYYLRRGTEDDVHTGYEAALRAVAAGKDEPATLGAVRVAYGSMRRELRLAHDALDRAVLFGDMDSDEALAVVDPATGDLETRLDALQSLLALDDAGRTLMCMTYGLNRDGVEYGEQDVADALGVSRSAVRAAHARLLKELRRTECV